MYQRQKANKYGFIRLTKPAKEPWSKKKGIERIITIEITTEDNLRIKRRKIGRRIQMSKV